MLSVCLSFLVGGDGTVYEGRGWGVVGAHAKGNNHDSVGVAFMGNFNSKFTYLYCFMTTITAHHMSRKLIGIKSCSVRTPSGWFYEV